MNLKKVLAAAMISLFATIGKSSVFISIFERSILKTQIVSSRFFIRCLCWIYKIN